MLVFDFDGVIVDSLSHYEAACRHTIKKFGIPIPETQDTFAKLENVNFEALANLLGTEEQLLATTITKYILEQPVKPAVFSGMPEIIKQSAANHSLHVLSAGAAQVAQSILSKNRLEGFFDSITGGDTPGSKAHKLKVLAKNNGEDAENIIMIGDSISDIEAAREFGCREIAITWGWHSGESLENLEPEYIAHTPEQLGQILQTVCS